jgi:hypothetical protein
MGNTPYYAIPYPDSTNAPDGPTQMKAIGDKIESLLKDGFTMPTGDFKVGDVANTTTRYVRLLKLDGGSTYECIIGVPGGGGLLFDVYQAGAQKVGLTMRTTGVVYQVVSGVSRPLPFAMFTSNLPIVPSGTGGAALTLPAGRFTATPMCFANIYGTMAFNANVNAATSTSINVVQSSSVNVAVDVLCVQMTPTTGPGLRTVPDGVTMRTGTCHTDDCENVEQPIEVCSTTADAPIICGPCGNPIDDITPAGAAAARRKASRKGEAADGPD